MTLNPTQRKFNAPAFEPIHQELVALEDEIDAYHAQKKKTTNLALVFFATFVLFTLNLAWNKLSGTSFLVAASSSSSLLLSLFDIALGGIILLFRMDETKKAKRFAQRINTLVLTTSRKFYGEVTERRQDSDTPPEVLESIQSNLKPHYEQHVPIEKDYILIATHEFTIEGDSADSFDWSSKKITDNFKEVEKTIGYWRKHYSKQYQDNPESRNSKMMQVYATQCIQNLPPVTIVEGPSSYKCDSPSAYRKLGHYSPNHQNNKTQTETVHNVESTFKHDELDELADFVVVEDLTPITPIAKIYAPILLTASRLQHTS
jgi:hypothetical protein